MKVAFNSIFWHSVHFASQSEQWLSYGAVPLDIGAGEPNEEGKANGAWLAQ